MGGRRNETDRHAGHRPGPDRSPARLQHRPAIAGQFRAPQETLPGLIEPVHAAAIARDEAVFWVTSNGCTAKEDITPVVRSSNDGPIITLRRIKEDRCRESRPEGTELRWSFEELGLAPGSRPSVENPYQLPPT